MNVLDTIVNKAIKKVISSSDHISSSEQKTPEEDTDLYSILENCIQEAQESEASGIMPSPKYFEEAVVLSRKEKKYENEIDICKYYIKLGLQYAAKNNFSKSEFVEKVERKIAPFNKRIYLAKTMLYKTSS